LLVDAGHEDPPYKTFLIIILDCYQKQSVVSRYSLAQVGAWPQMERLIDNNA